MGRESIEVGFGRRIELRSQAGDDVGRDMSIPEVPQSLEDEPGRLARTEEIAGDARRKSSVSLPKVTFRGTPSVRITILAGT
jgi:hypothetical protein